MRADSSQINVATADRLFHSVHTIKACLRPFTEVCREGQSPAAAVERLADMLSLTSDNAPSDSHWEMIQRDIEDARASDGRDRLRSWNDR
jgi:hypothetical protein